MEYAIQLLVSLLIGIFAGQWLDAKLGTSPWMTLAGLIIGMVLGFGVLYKRAMAMQEKQKTDKQAKKDKPE